MSVQCSAITLKGNQCKIICKNEFCHIHIENCSICLNTFKSKVKLSCSHQFCKNCIYKWMLTNNSCPMCRKDINYQKGFVKYAFENKFYINLKKYDIIISNLPSKELDMLSLFNIYVGSFLNKSLWEIYKKDYIFKDLVKNINTNVKVITFIAKINPQNYNYYDKNQEMYFFY